MPIKIYFKTLSTLVLFFQVIISFSQIQITYPLNRMVFQRNAANNATVAITGQYQKNIDRIEAQFVPVQGGTATGWQLVQNNPQAGWYSGSLNVQGGWYQLEVRGLLNGSVVVNTVLSRVGVGEVFLIAGQSNASGYPNYGGPAAADDRVNCVDFNNSSYALSLFQPTFVHLDANTNISPNGKSAWCWGRLGDLIASRFNVPVMFFNGASEGTGVKAWSESANGQTATNTWTGGPHTPGMPFGQLKIALNYYAAMTGARAVLWHQGETDKHLSTTTADYSSYLQNVITKSRAFYGNNVGWAVARASHFLGGGSAAVIAGQNAAISSSSNTFAGPNTESIQIPRADGDVHFQGQGLVDLANAWNTALDNNFFNNCIPVSGYYPTITASCGGNNMNINVAGVSSVQWSHGVNATATSLSPSSYSAQAVGGPGNVYFIPNFAVPNDLAPTSPTITANGSTVLCSNGSVSLLSNATTGNIWSTGATSQQITASTVGNYSVAVKNKYSCAASSNTISVTASTLPAPPAPTITTSNTSSTCAGGQITLTSSSGASGYIWSNGSTAQSITVNVNGTYSVQTLNAQGCGSAPTNINVAIPSAPPPPSITASGSTTFCQGGQVTLTSNAASGNVWSNGQTTQSITVGSSGNYTVQVTNGSCTSTSNTITVTVNATPAKPVIFPQKPVNFCSGDNTVLVSNVSGQYNWSSGQNSQSITVSSAGTFSLTVTSPQGCTSPLSDPITTNVLPLPAPPTISANRNPVICANESVIISSNPQNAYAWNISQSGQSVNINQSGTYWVRAVDANGCYSYNSNSINVTVNPLPAQPTINPSGNVSVCQGQQINLQSNYGGNILWSTNQNTQTIGVGSSGSYTVRYTDGNGCQSVSNPTNVNVNALPAAPNISNLSPTTFCQGNSTTLSIPLPSNSYSYLWSTGENSQNITLNNAASVWAKVTQISTGCTSPQSATVNTFVNPLPPAPTISSNRNPSICSYENITFASNAQGNYAWNNGGNAQNITVNQAGNYYVQTTDGNGCTSPPSNIINLVVNQPPAKPVISAYGPTAFCIGKSLGLEATNYTSNLTWNTNETTKQITVSTAGNYTVKYKDANNCETTSDPVGITIYQLPAAPTINNLLPTTFCQNDNTVLTIPLSSNDYQYNWSTGQDSQNITVNTATTINATVTYKPTGCVSPLSSSVTTTINPLPAAPIVTTNRAPVICANENITLTSNPQISYRWNGGVTTQSITINENGNYYVQAIDNNKCISPPSNIISLLVNPLPPKPVISPYGSTTFCQGQKLGLEATNYSSSLIWNTNETTKQITVATAGDYKVTHKDNNGCESSSDAMKITVNPLPEAPKINNERPVVFCQNDSTILSIPLSPNDYNFTWSNDGASQKTVVKNTSTITATVTYQPTGCTSLASEAVKITMNPNPSQPAITTASSTTFCADQSVTLTANEPTAVSYLWSTQATNKSITVNTEGNYSVKVTNQFGCNSIFSVPTSVKVNPLPPKPTIIIETPPTFCDGDQANLRVDSPNEVQWNTNEIGKSIVIKKTGNYVTRVKDGNGCFSPFSDAAKIEVKTLPATPVIEKGGVYMLFAKGSDPTGAYNWTLDGKAYNDKRSTIKARQQGSYQVQVAVKHSPTLTCYSKVATAYSFVPETGVNSLGIYPNPASGLILVETYEDLKNVNVNIYSAEGRIIHQYVVPLMDEAKQFDVSFLPPGTYILEVMTTDYRATKKLIIGI